MAKYESSREGERESMSGRIRKKEEKERLESKQRWRT
jgi:hypothetical protein